jgi:16S rRNA (adenine1518-N6/adenine1519-N6)-dimethyltransferase
VPRTSTGSSSPPSAEPEPARAPHGAASIRERLAAIGVRPRKSFGQSFLVDPFIADIEAALVEVPTGSPVTEIGGGLGLLTEALLRRGIGPLRVIERDPRLARHLKMTFGGAIRVEQADALGSEFGTDSAVVGNLPFSVASPILTRLFEARVPRIVALLQKEVGLRYASAPGGRGYGRPAIQAALYGSVETFAPVPARAFEPTPAVDGLIVRFTDRGVALPVPSVPEFEHAVQVLFSARRKQLGNLLPRLAGGDEAAAELAAASGWPTDWARRRPEELAPEYYFALATARARR